MYSYSFWLTDILYGVGLLGRVWSERMEAICSLQCSLACADKLSGGHKCVCVYVREWERGEDWGKEG